MLFVDVKSSLQFICDFQSSVANSTSGIKLVTSVSNEQTTEQKDSHCESDLLALNCFLTNVVSSFLQVHFETIASIQVWQGPHSHHRVHHFEVWVYSPVDLGMILVNFPNFFHI